MLKKKLPGIISAALLATGASAAQAQDTVQDIIQEYNWYAGANLTWLDASSSLTPNESSVVGLYGRAGMFINPNFSTEFRLGMGFGDDNVIYEDAVTGASVEGTAEVGAFYGVYARGGWNLTESIYPYAVIGYTRGEYNAAVGGVEFSDTENDISWGVGADFEFQQGFTGNLEYTVLLDKPDYQLNGISLGVSVAF